MHRRPKLRGLIALIVIGVVVAMAVIMAVLFGLKSKHEIDVVPTPPLLYDFDISPQHIEGIKGTINTTQGATVHINLTLTSECKAKMAIPIEPLRLTGYYKNVTSRWVTSFPWGEITPGENLTEKYGDSPPWEIPEIPIQEEIFSYSLSLNELTLEPGMSNSTIITISLADNVPIGGYSISLDLGEMEFLSAPGENYISYTHGMNLYLTVTSSG